MRIPLLVLACSITLGFADEVGPGKKAPEVSGEAAMKSFSVSPGMQVELWASEPMLANPVAFSFDDAGRAYVAETYRRRSSVLDIRKYDEWKVPNLGLRTVEDRIAFIKGKFPENGKTVPTKEWPDFNKDGAFDWRDLAIESERVRVIEDSSGDGKPDKARFLAEGFNSLETTVGAGVVAAPGGGVFYTCAPDLWKIGADGTKTKLLTGFSVHLVFSGHEMHGARMGPDGRLYFSIADCGAHVVNREGKTIANPDSGAVFRCWPDGSEFELFATGLRNPQHIVFNEFGDLFTADNNADGGDKARWIHVLEGGDYGWRIGWQFLPKLGLWNAEGQYFLNIAETNPAILPPVAHIGHGPAGIAYDPGTGLPEIMRGHFFYADFPGGIRHFGLKKQGATYALSDYAPDAPVLQNNQGTELTGKLLWNLNPSDVQFAPGGGVMVLDWTPGWEKTGKGRIYRVFDPAVDKDPLVQETRTLLKAGFAHREVKDLARLLGHADQRVRMGAQYALVEKKAGAAFVAVVADSAAPLLGRIHALWGLGQLRDGAVAAPAVKAALADANDELHAQAWRVVADARWAGFDAEILGAIQKGSPRVSAFAARAAAKRSLKGAGAALVARSREARSDSAWRAALVEGVASTMDEEQLIALSSDANPAARELATLGLRKQRSAALGRLVAEKSGAELRAIVQAIHDTPIPGALDAVSKLSGAPLDDVAVARRVINASYRLGTSESASRLAGLAAEYAAKSGEAVAGKSKSNAPTGPEVLALDALDALNSWAQALGRDRILGIVVEGDGKREQKDAATALEKVFPAIIAARSVAIRTLAAEAAGNLKVASAEGELYSAVTNSNAEPAFRTASLRALAALDSGKLADAIRSALDAKDKALAGEARRLVGKLGGAAAVEANAAVLGKGAIREQQDALANLARLKEPAVDAILATQLDLLLTAKLPPALHLDVLEAAATRSSEAVKTKLAAYEQTRKAGDPLARWQECMEGGDAKAGRVLFAEKAEAGCMRCHAVNKDGGDVGPDLGGLGSKRDRAYLLRAIVEPNSEIAPGYENLLITLQNDDVLAGMAFKEDATTLTLKNPADGKLQDVKKADIKDRQKLPSAMPPGLGDVLGRRALRDVLEYLASLRGK